MPSNRRSEWRTKGETQIWKGCTRKDATARNQIALKIIANALKPRLPVQIDASAALVGTQKPIDRSDSQTDSQLLQI